MILGKLYIFNLKAIQLFFLACISQLILAAAPLHDSIPGSTPQQAINYINTIKQLDSSRLWPNIDPVLLLQNLNASIRGPLKSFEGKNTNFCAYTALVYVPLRNDPMGFARFIIDLYQKGSARMGKATIKPSLRVREAAGLLQYKGELDINHLAQIWFLSLADHFKGYLNITNLKFHEGDENRIWASTNFSKFNRMLRKLYGHKVKAKGADLVRPHFDNIYNYLKDQMRQGTVFLYLNNRMLYRKNHEVSRFGIPTHYVVLTDIIQDGENLKIIYWDAGRKTLQEVSPYFLGKIVYGVSTCLHH